MKAKAITSARRDAQHDPGAVPGKAAASVGKLTPKQLHARLLRAVQSENLAGIESLLDAGAPVNRYRNGEDQDGTSAFEVATEKDGQGSEAILRLLIDKGMSLGLMVSNMDQYIAVDMLEGLAPSVLKHWQNASAIEQEHGRVLKQLEERMSSPSTKQDWNPEMTPEAALASWTVYLARQGRWDLVESAANWGALAKLAPIEEVWTIVREMSGELSKADTQKLDEHFPTPPEWAWTGSVRDWEKDGPGEWRANKMEASAKQINAMEGPVYQRALFELSTQLKKRTSQRARQARGFVKAAQTRPELLKYLQRFCEDTLTLSSILENAPLCLALRKQVAPGMLKDLDHYPSGLFNLAFSGSVPLFRAYLEDRAHSPSSIPFSAPTPSAKRRGGKRENRPHPVAVVLGNWMGPGISEALFWASEHGFEFDLDTVLPNEYASSTVSEVLSASGEEGRYQKLIAARQAKQLDKAVAKGPGGRRARM